MGTIIGDNTVYVTANRILLYYQSADNNLAVTVNLYYQNPIKDHLPYMFICT